jgi:hypothetical protein
MRSSCRLDLLTAVATIVLPPFVSTALAAPPKLTDITPRGAERGKPVEIVVTGANLTLQSRLAFPFPASQKLLPEPKPDPTRARFQILIDASVPLAIYPVRVVSEEGISSYVLFGVDAFPNLAEVEDNSTFDRAQRVPMPVVITGQCPGGDVDFFRFTARRGQHVVIETEAARLGSGVVPQIRVTDARQRFVAADDTQALRGDCRVAFTAPADGDYVVELSDSRYRGGNPPHYRLKIGDYDVVGETFPLGGRRGDEVKFCLRGGSLGGEVCVVRRLDDAPHQGRMPLALDGLLRPGMLAPEVAVGDLPERIRETSTSAEPRALDVLPPLTLNGRLPRPGDVHRCQFSVRPGERYRLRLEAETLGSALDGVLRITDQTGTRLNLVADDSALVSPPDQPPLVTADPSAEVAVPDGVSLLRVEVRDQRGRGGLNFGYRLTIEPARADFLVQQRASEINVPRRGSAALTVGVTRRGYNGPIQLRVADLPPGLAVHGGHVPANGVSGLLTLSAAADANVPATGFWSLRLEGQGLDQGRPLLRQGEQHILLSRDAGGASPVLTLPQVAVALTAPEPFAVRGPAAIEVVKGYSVPVPVTITRAQNQDLAIDVTASASRGPAAAGAPPGPLSIKPGTAAAGSPQASFTLSAAANAPDGALDLVVQGKAKVGGAEKLVIGPAVAVTVRNPFALELLTSKLSLLPGQTVALKGRVLRAPVFKEPVQVVLTGLPAGVTLVSPARSLAGDWSEFQLDLKADPKAPPAAAGLVLTCSTTIAGAVFTHPAIPIPLEVSAGK